MAQSWNYYDGGLKGLMIWSLNWDGSTRWTFGDNVKALLGADAAGERRVRSGIRGGPPSHDD
ncbi:hypothetical protein [Micromonospora sp. NPDC002931]|uniref:hypothetical protein n=1 Tax=unclassified Micromonospora TaxID=2617518 RepID=UPI0036AA029A